MKGVLLTFLAIITGLTGMAQLKEVDSGVYKWSELPIKEGDQRVGRKIMEGVSPHFSFLELHATTQEEGATTRSPTYPREYRGSGHRKRGTLKINDETAKVKCCRRAA